MTAYCPHCLTQRDARQYDGQWQCVFCGHVFSPLPEPSPDESKAIDADRTEKLYEPFTKHVEVMQ